MGKRQPRFSSRDTLLDATASATLDLHGLTAVEARAVVTAFMRGRPGGVLIHIITGKGRGSAKRPVLRSLVAGMLKGELAPQLADWSPDASEGGFRVRLR